MDEKKRTVLQEIISKLNILVNNQKYIKADTTAIGQMLQQYFIGKQAEINNSVPFIIEGMTEAQAKSLMKQGMYPEIVALYSGNKFTVAHLYKLVSRR